MTGQFGINFVVTKPTVKPGIGTNKKLFDLNYSINREWRLGFYFS